MDFFLLAVHGQASNITYGFESMLCCKSAHNIFRLLMFRDLNLYELKGVLFDHSCGLDQYLLNRGPREFEFLRCLVDGAHWLVCSFFPSLVLVIQIFFSSRDRKSSISLTQLAEADTLSAQKDYTSLF